MMALATARLLSALVLAFAIHDGPEPVRATWYQTPGIMRNGERYDPLALTCAVDDSRWTEMQGKRITLVGPEGMVEVEVTDTGWLGAGNVDLTPAAFERIGDLDDGVVKVRRHDG